VAEAAAPLLNNDVRVLFQDLADLSRTQREWQYRKRRVPAEVREELESLLDFDDPGTSPMNRVVAGAAEKFLLQQAPVSGNGGRCGPYRLIRPLGNGGMGAVYLAERADGEVQQSVAIKFLHSRTADLPTFRERFLRERQILASLHHPGIARLIDAGHADGHPYLVMEFIDGVRIDEFLKDKDQRTVLSLFLEVAEAVSYAHRNLIIHRDLKPSNILIDASGKPKLLDFGIAKILSDEEHRGIASRFPNVEDTRTAERLLTPEYASPEQVAGKAQATTTDVFSLGAVLCRLLTGMTPRTAELWSFSTTGLPKDLAVILNKAMRDEPEDRYSSVDHLAADIRAFLNHQPVAARRGNAWYMARKFTRRHWMPMLAGLLAVSGLAGGVLLANHERAIAQGRFHQVRQLSREFLELEAQIRDLPGSTKARNHIVSSSLSYLERLGAETRQARWLSFGRSPSQQDLDLSLEIAQAYSQVAGIQGVQGANSLGQFEQAKASLAHAEVFAETVLQAPKFPRRAEALLASAVIAHQNMILADSENRPEDNLAYAGRASMRLNEALALKAGAALPPDTTKRAAGIFVNLTLTYQKRNRLDDASLNARRAVELARRVTPADPRMLSKCLSVLANTARFTGQFEEAKQAIEEARRMAESSMTDAPNVDQTLTLVAALWREAMLLGEYDGINLGRGSEAAALLRRAFQLSDALAARDSNDYTSRSYVSMAGRELGDLLRDKNPAEALQVYQRTFDRLEEVRHNRKARYDQISVLAGMSYALRGVGRPSEAATRIEMAMRSLRELREPVTNARSAASEEAESAWRALADHLSATGAMVQAAAIYEDLVAKPFPVDQPGFKDLRRANRLSGMYRDLAAVHQGQGAAGTTRARELDSKRRELWRHWERKLPGNSFVRQQATLAATLH